MHEPLPREFRINDAPIGVLGLVWACALTVMIAVACVGVASITGELYVRNRAQVAGPSTQTAGSATVLVARSGSSSNRDLFSNMPQP
jgi:hypothetical protein